uniref:N-acetyltransferase n=1 Tax=Thermogemmatispora argillosa TaxID=2045280 RepID=A0A455T594_9CHLR|nr:N-acetyltransferase [Thermogemmatispora argillosa]
MSAIVHIREIAVEDAEAFLQLCHRLDQETHFMLLEPDERTLTVDEQRQALERLIASGREMIFVAEEKQSGQLVGYLAIRGGTFRREQHRASLVIGVVQAFSGQGIGSRLFQAMERWARQRGFHRLELTVMVHNQRALALYHKQGFVIEGRRCHALYVDGRYVDEYYMAKLLD